MDVRLCCSREVTVNPGRERVRGFRRFAVCPFFQVKEGPNLGNPLLSHYAAGNAGPGKRGESRNGRPRLAGSRQGPALTQIVVITVLAVIGSYCGEVTTGPPPYPARQVTAGTRQRRPANQPRCDGAQVWRAPPAGPGRRSRCRCRASAPEPPRCRPAAPPPAAPPRR